MMAVFAGADWAIAAGDDCIEQWKPGAQLVYQKLGRICKFYDKCDDRSFVFCSRQYTDGWTQPVGWLKGLFNILNSKEPKSDLLDDFKRTYYECDQYIWMLTILAHVGWDV